MSELDVSNLLTVDEAIEIIDSVAVSARSESVLLSEAVGRHLADDIVADRDYPPFDKSLMDGFAVRAADAGPRRLIGEVSAGTVFGRAVGTGECVAIYTGAPMPAGADAVVPVEFSKRANDSVDLHGEIRVGQNIARRGSDCEHGRVIVQRGASINPATIAVAASVGLAQLKVFELPRIAVLSTGDELVPVESVPTGGQIRNSNGPMLLALLARYGFRAHDAGSARDDRATIRAAIDRALSQHDVLFITGGMSMGEYDFVPRVLQDLGFDLMITKLKIKPGKPFVFATRDGKFVFGLPGNPVSGFVCTVRLAARLLARVSGGAGRDVERFVHGPLTSALATNGPREFYQPAIVQPDGAITPLAWKGSADIFTLARANAFLIRAENDPAQESGAKVAALMLP